MKRLLATTIAALVMAAVVASTAFAASASPIKTPGVIYDSLVSPLPGNIASVGPEAYAFNELGNAVTFAGTSRNLSNVVVTMSSWGCQTGHWNSNDCSTLPGATFSQDITLNIYSGDPSISANLLGSVTQTFNILYRPSASAKCKGGNLGEWTAGHGCFNGIAANFAFDFSTLGLTLPNNVIFGIAYNTTHHGYAPIGENTPCYTSSGGCPYDSLNIGLSTKTSVGTAGLIWQYSNGGWNNTGFGNYIPAVQFNAGS